MRARDFIAENGAGKISKRNQSATVGLHKFRDKNLKITPKTHEMLKQYCEENGLKMFAFVEKLIREKCQPKKGLYDED